MLTKTGGAIEALIAAGGGSMGALRANELTDEQRKALTNKYDLHPEANLMARNAGRGVAGGILGATAGGLAGGVLGGIIAGPGAGQLAGQVGGLYGAYRGAQRATDKYSVGSAQKLVRRGFSKLEE